MESARRRTERVGREDSKDVIGGGVVGQAVFHGVEVVEGVAEELVIELALGVALHKRIVLGGGHQRHVVAEGHRGGVESAKENYVLPRLEELFVPEGACDLGVRAAAVAGLGARAFFEPLGVLARPHVFVVPKGLDEGLGAVHELLAVGHLKRGGRAVPREVRAVLALLVDDETDVGLEVQLRHLEYRLVVVQSEHVQGAGHVQQDIQVEDQVPPEVLQWRGLLVRVGCLLVLPARLHNRLLKLEAPVGLFFRVLAPDAPVLAGDRAHHRGQRSLKALLVGANKLFAGLAQLGEGHYGKSHGD